MPKEVDMDQRIKDIYFKVTGEKLKHQDDVSKLMNLDPVAFEQVRQICKENLLKY